MKNLIAILIIVFFYNSTKAQAIFAQYEMKRVKSTPTKNSPEASITLPLTAFYYRDGNKSIFLVNPII